jgi:hypothetical protein
MRGTIDRIWENESRSGQKYLTVQVGSERYSVWDDKYFDMLQEGVTIDYDFKQSGNFKNMTDIEPANGNGNGLPQYQPNNKDRQIARMSCLKSASEILAPVQLDPDAKKDLTIDTARFFERYVFEGDTATDAGSNSGGNHGRNGR